MINFLLLHGFSVFENAAGYIPISCRLATGVVKIIVAEAYGNNVVDLRLT